ncbi:MAG: hypothetical protein J6A89_03590 [Clostridia bacterium]|nr:hypothetical protein [Clostridia bacterium]MBO5375548.1 hypothetical protein [Bacilli bacterium]
MLKIFIIAMIVICCLFLYSACVVSGRISREEEQQSYVKENKKSMD